MPAWFPARQQNGRGGHDRCSEVESVPSPVRTRDDWAHLAYEPPPHHYLTRALNRIRLDDLRALTEKYFAIETWKESPIDEKRGAGRLTDEIRRRYPQYTERELTTQGVLCRAKKRAGPRS